MELERFSELYRRIRTEPSILLLGQGYLGLTGEPDPIWAGLEKEYADQGISPRVVDYPALWKAVVQQKRTPGNFWHRSGPRQSGCRRAKNCEPYWICTGACFTRQRLTKD